MSSETEQQTSVSTEDGNVQNGGAENKEELTDLEQKIITQVEYYFGDINLPRDKFLKTEVNKDEGWIPMSTMLKFNRLKALSEDPKVILAALLKSETGIVEIDEANEKIRRSLEHPLPENCIEYWNEMKKKTVYVKGIPKTCTLDDVQAFFAPYVSPAHIYMRRVDNKERLFKGSVFATFKNVEDRQKFLDNPPKKYNESAEEDLIIKSQEEYYKNKMHERQQRKLENKMIKEEQKKMMKPNKRNNKPQQEREPEPTDLKTGMILRVSGLPEKCSIKQAKLFFRKYGSVYYFHAANEAGTEADLIFRGENGAEEAWKKTVEDATDGKVVFLDSEIEGRVLEGEEAEKAWSDAQEGIKAMINPPAKDNRGRRGGRDGGGGGKNWKQKGKRSGGSDVPAPQGKKIKFQDSDEEGEGGKDTSEDTKAGAEEKKDDNMDGGGEQTEEKVEKKMEVSSSEESSAAPGEDKTDSEDKSESAPPSAEKKPSEAKGDEKVGEAEVNGS